MLGMLRLAILFVVLAIIAGLLGFTGVEIIPINIARALCLIFIVLFLIFLFLAGPTFGIVG